MEKWKKNELVRKIESSQTVQKGKNGISSVVFGRTFMVFLSLFLQLIFMIWDITGWHPNGILSMDL